MSKHYTLTQDEFALAKLKNGDKAEEGMRPRETEKEILKTEKGE